MAGSFFAHVCHLLSLLGKVFLYLSKKIKFKNVCIKKDDKKKN
jgi:hypothetical protein